MFDMFIYLIHFVDIISVGVAVGEFSIQLKTLTSSPSMSLEISNRFRLF